MPQKLRLRDPSILWISAIIIAVAAGGLLISPGWLGRPAGGPIARPISSWLLMRFEILRAHLSNDPASRIRIADLRFRELRAKAAVILEMPDTETVKVLNKTNMDRVGPTFSITADDFKRMAEQFAPVDKDLALVAFYGFPETGQGKSFEEFLVEVTQLLKSVGFKHVKYLGMGHGHFFPVYKSGLPSPEEIEKHKEFTRRLLSNAIANPPSNH